MPSTRPRDERPAEAGATGSCAAATPRCGLGPDPLPRWPPRAAGWRSTCRTLSASGTAPAYRQPLPSPPWPDRSEAGPASAGACACGQVAGQDEPMVDTDVVSSQPSYARGRTDTPLIEQTIGDNLDATVRRHGDREALVEVASGRRWTYAELLADVERLARALLASGIGKGDRVGIWAPNCAEWTIVQFATAKMGAILVNINPSYRTHELSFVLNQAGVRLIVVAEPFRTSDYPAMVEQVRDECPELERVVVIGQPSWDELVERGAELSAEQLADVQGTLTQHDPINIQYTSGTTGFPKGATLSHRNILNNGFFVGEGCSYTEVDR